MIGDLLRTGVQLLLALRYRVRVRGATRIARRGTRGILFLPNHPGLIDPPIVLSALHHRFHPRALADQDQINLPVVRWVARQVNVIPIPDIKAHGRAVAAEVAAARQECINTLQTGGNVLLYPSGHIARSRYEDLYGNSGAHDIAASVPNARIVLVRTRGVWGSSLTMASGEFPHLGDLLWRHLANLVASYLFFMPRRHVSIELFEPDDLPRDAGRRPFNDYLQQFYNTDVPPALHVAYQYGEDPVRRELPEPRWGVEAGSLESVPQRVRERVLAHLCEVADVDNVRDDQRLANDLGLDSLARSELLLWLHQEFGSTEQDGDALHTVGDVLLAACGQSVVLRPVAVNRPPKAWLQPAPVAPQITNATTVTQAFLDAARRKPSQVIIADQLRGTRTYRDLITAILVLKPHIEALPGDTIGIMLPASVGATTVYWATLFAGKTPLMVNWTTGTRNMQHSLELAGVQHILTAGPLIARLKGQGIDFGPIDKQLVPLETIGERISTRDKLLAAARSYVDWSPLERSQPPETIAVLVTSGSETLPKAVPLTHTNVLTNIRDVVSIAGLRDDDRMLAFLPPFHSFGLTATTILPLVAGLPVAYHANPTEAAQLVRLIAAYQSTLTLGTPTFLSGILRACGDPRQLASLRLIVTGAEKCPASTYAALGRLCPQATVLEGYGITECSPIVAVNRPQSPKPGTVGPVLPSVEHVLVDVERDAPVARGEQGMLLVRGPSIFDGYLGDDVASPFVEHAGKSWYRTGDLVSEDDDGVLTFRGRLKRFVKIGGEMVSLPAIEAALWPHIARDDDEGPPMAVVASRDEGRPELVVFTIRPLDRATANARIREAGLSSLHNISRVIELPEIPLLGNGKTNYRALEGQV